MNNAEASGPGSRTVPAGMARAASGIRRAGGMGGLAERIATIAGALPRSTTEHAVYNLATAVGLWTSDLADALEGGAVQPTHRTDATVAQEAPSPSQGERPTGESPEPGSS